MLKMKNLIVACFLLISCSMYAQQNVVSKYGNLKIKGNYVFGEKGDTVQLRGMSLFWSQWMGQYYNAEAINWLVSDWKCNVVRAAMGVEMDKGGYAKNPEKELAKVYAVIDAAIANGIYVIVDYHSHEAHNDVETAKKFFAQVATKYGKTPNVIYEIYNEPLDDADWKKHIKPYAEQVIATIRAIDPDNIVVVGTRQWSQMVSEAGLAPIAGNNIAYTLHYYAGTHGQWLRDEAVKAMNSGICLMVTEFGTCDASGNGNFTPEESKKWFDFMDKYHLSWCNWSVADKDETASALKPGAAGTGKWDASMITESGALIKKELLKNTVVKKK